MKENLRKSTSPTVQDVAREANVSTATVSRAISNPKMVSEKTRLKVTEAVAKTGYVLNHAARNLRRRNTDTIVALVPDIGNSHLSNVLQGIETVCDERDFKVLIADTRKPSMSRSTFLDYLSKANCDGIISLDGHFSIAEMRSIQPDMPPIGTAGEWSDDPDVPIAVINNLLGAKMAMSHLIELGHTNIGHITGALDHRPGLDRLEGFRASLMHVGSDPDAAWVFEGDYTIEVGVEAAKDFLQLDIKPTAVFCARDRTAFGFMSTLAAAGVSVPDDVSIVGFDDLDIAAYYIPPLTTIHQPRRKVGAQAAQLMLRLIDGEKPRTTRNQIEPWLVVRNSTAAPK